MKKLVTGVMLVALVCSLGAMTVSAAEGENNARPSFGQRGERGERKEISEADKAAMEAAMAQHKEKLDAFVNTLTDEQKALYEAMRPAAPAEGQRFERPAAPAEGQRFERPANIQHPERPDNSEMRAKHDAFIASLTEDQKAAYEELMGSMQRGFGAKKDK